MSSNEPKPPVSPDEMAQAAGGAAGDPALEGGAPAAIDAAAEGPQTPFE
jgi:hypothetical protein